MQRTLITLATAVAIAVAVAVPYLSGAEASSVQTLNAERTAVVLLDGTENVAPVSTTEAAGLVQETDSAQAKQILQKIGATALWSYDPSSAKFESLARKIPAAGTAIYVRPKTIQTIETIVEPSLLAVSSTETSDTMPTPYIHSLYRHGPRRFTWTYNPGEGWTTGGGDLVDNPWSTNTDTARNPTATSDEETPVGTTTTTTTVPTTTTTVPTTTTTTDPATTTSTTDPTTTTTLAPTTTSTSTSTTTTLAPRPTTTTTTTTVPKKRAVTTTTSTTSTTTTTTTLPATTTTTDPTTPVSTALAAPAGYSASQLEFNDPASATAINSSLWNTYITSAAAQGQPWNSNGQGGSSAAGSGDFDAEYDLPGQVTEGNGVIDLRATDTPSDGYPWTSGTISSYGKFQFDGGYLQVEAKMPAGSGMWPGIWMLPGAGATDGDNYEIDLFEGGYDDGGAGSSYTNMFAWHLHTPNGTFGADSNTDVNLTTSFNTYGLKWIPGQSITWYLNGSVIGTVTSAEASIPNEPMELIMDLQVANSNTTQWHSQVNSSTPFNNDMLISGVQVYS